MKRSRNEKGFTLIEFLVVLIILGILLAIAIPAYDSFRHHHHKSGAPVTYRIIA